MIIEHGLFNPDLLEECLAEFPDANDAGWGRFGNAQEFKLEGGPALWGPRTRFYFDRLAEMASRFSRLFNIPDLHLEMIGGGYHLIPPGGYLDVHTDFSRSPQTGRYRRLNVLTYLNHQWGPDDGGELEIWGDAGPLVTIRPEFGTTVAFITSSTSWHGHPKPTTRWRASLAGYFFTDEPPTDFTDQSTVFHPNGGRRA